MKKPWLVQRCELGADELKYEYMGATEFEVGDQAMSLERIFAAGMVFASTTINVGGKEVSVFMVASEGFPFAEYQPYLQQLADHKLRLQEWTCFDEVVKRQVGVRLVSRYIPSTNVWFDFRNDVLWTLTEDNQKTLVAILEGIKQKWTEKEKAKS